MTDDTRKPVEGLSGGEAAELPVGDLQEIGLLWVELADKQGINHLHAKASQCRQEATYYRDGGRDSLADRAQADAGRLERLANLLEKHAHKLP